MILLGIVFAIILMGVMISMALNKKSNFSMRIASLIALAAMILTVLICLFIIFTDNRVPFDPSNVIVGATPAVQETDNRNIIMLLLAGILLLAIFGVIAYHSMKEHRKNIKSPSGGIKPVRF